MTDEKNHCTDVEVRKPDAVLSPIPDAKNIRLLATDLFNSRIFRGIESIPQAIATIQYGAEMGIPPATALTKIKLIKGQFSIAAAIIMGLAATKTGTKWKIIESTDKRCELLFTRPGWEPMTSIATIEEAMTAGLVKSDSAWQTYPQDMLFKTAGVRGCRRIAMDATLGMYSTEEMEGVEIIETTASPETATDIFPEPGPVQQQDKKPEGEKPKAKEPDPGDELSAMAEHQDDAAAQEGDDPETEVAITKIKSYLEQEGVDLGSFKEWLFKYQNTLRPVKAYIGKIGKSYRFHLGKKKDTIQLADFIERAVKTFRTGKESK